MKGSILCWRTISWKLFMSLSLSGSRGSGFSALILSNVVKHYCETLLSPRFGVTRTWAKGVKISRRSGQETSGGLDRQGCTGVISAYR
ncbi:hypothetical protein HDK77DRAFT_145495 [Phyllosticta capitalensis]